MREQNIEVEQDRREQTIGINSEQGERTISAGSERSVRLYLKSYNPAALCRGENCKGGSNDR